MAWAFLAKVLGEAAKKAASEVAKQAAKKVAVSAAQKVAEKGVGAFIKKAATSGIQKIAGAANAVSSANPQNKSAVSKILNILVGDLGKNFKSTGSMMGRAGELPKGALPNKIKAALAGDLGEQFKKAKVPANLEAAVSGLSDQKGAGKIGKLNDLIGAITSKPQQVAKGQKLADTVNNTLFGEGFGSNVLRRTMASAAQQGIFSGSDVGQPEKDKWGILGNSVLGGVAGAAMDTMQQQFDYRQQIQQMMADFNPADESFKNFQPAMLDKIKGFQDYIIGVGANKKGLQKGKYNSQEMLDITGRFAKLQNEIGQYNKSSDAYRRDYSEFQKNYSKYDPIDFKLGSEYFLKYGRYPDKGLLSPAEVDPNTFFSNLSVSNKDSWKPVNPNAPYEMASPLTSEQKKALAGTYFYTNPGLQKYIMRNEVPKWKEQYGGDKELMKMFTKPDGQFDDSKFAEFMTAYNYGDKIEQNKVDWDKKVKYMEQRKSDAEKTAKEQKAEEEKRGYYLTQNYPYDSKQSGPAIVFKKAYAENIPPQILQDATGATVSTDDEVVPVTFEYVDKSGNLVVTAAVNEAGTQRKRRLNIPPGKSRGLLESYFPGITSDTKTEQMFNPKNEQPIGVYSQAVEDKISLFMEKNGINDRNAAIKKLQELKIL